MAGKVRQRKQPAEPTALLFLYWGRVCGGAWCLVVLILDGVF